MYVELCSLACLILTVGSTWGENIEFTFLLPAGSTECFYQTAARNDSMEVEYQVNITFFLSCLTVWDWYCDSVTFCLLRKASLKFVINVQLSEQQVNRIWTLVLHAER